MADFLLEIGTEEIPDWMIEPALGRPARKISKPRLVPSAVRL